MPKDLLPPCRRGTGGYVKSLEEHGNGEGRPETQFPNVGLNRVGPGDHPEAVEEAELNFEFFN